MILDKNIRNSIRSNLLHTYMPRGFPYEVGEALLLHIIFIYPCQHKPKQYLLNTIPNNIFFYLSGGLRDTLQSLSVLIAGVVSLNEFLLVDIVHKDPSSVAETVVSVQIIHPTILI